MCREAARYEILPTVLCAANSYKQLYYLNPEFGKLPDAVKAELQAMCVLYTEDVGGILTVGFDDYVVKSIRRPLYAAESHSRLPAQPRNLRS